MLRWNSTIRWAVIVCLVTIIAFVSGPIIEGFYAYIIIQGSLMAAWVISVYSTLISAKLNPLKWIWVFALFPFIFSYQLSTFWAWTVWSIGGFV